MGKGSHDIKFKIRNYISCEYFIKRNIFYSTKFETVICEVGDPIPQKQSGYSVNYRVAMLCIAFSTDSAKLKEGMQGELQLEPKLPNHILIAHYKCLSRVVVYFAFIFLIVSKF